MLVLVERACLRGTSAHSFLSEESRSKGWRDRVMMYSLGPMDLVVPGSRKSTPGFCLVIDPINSHLKKAGLSSVALLPLATKKDLVMHY